MSSLSDDFYNRLIDLFRDLIMILSFIDKMVTIKIIKEWDYEGSDKKNLYGCRLKICVE